VSKFTILLFISVIVCSFPASSSAGVAYLLGGGTLLGLIIGVLYFVGAYFGVSILGAIVAYFQPNKKEAE